MILDTKVRPQVAFDVSNKSHRRYFREFFKTGSWSSCPVRFVTANDSEYFTIQRLLSEYYLNKEFGND